MVKKEYTGKNVKQALKNAEADLGIAKDKLEYVVLDEGKGGILSFGSAKDARIQVKTDSAVAQKLDPKAESLYQEEALAFLKGLFERMDLAVDVNVAGMDEGKLFIQFESDRSALLIGRRGKTLEAIQMLVNIVAAKRSGYTMKTVVDIENYRGKRESVLNELALKIAEDVKRAGKPRSLEPMNPFERRLIHLALQNVKDVETRSEGEGVYRKVVILPKR
jgi:spoIIIJ-associated protein